APVLHFPECLVHELFERQAARTPVAAALVLGDESLSYGELDRRANRLARHLRGRGVGAEVRVAVFLERSFDMVTGVLAILKAGGAYVPLDPSYPAERLAYQVRDSGATLLLTTRALLDRLGSTPADAMLVDEEAEAIGRESDAAPPCAAAPENLAYVVYTSGSTGRPKGVMVPHRGVVSYLAALVREYGLAPGDVVLQRSTLSFDASVRDLLGPLTAGARVVLVHTHEAADPVVLMRRIREHRVSAILAIVPSILRPLLDAAEEAAPTASLRLLLVSGEPLAVADCHRARRAFGSGVRVVNLWGATECTMSSSFHTVEEEDGEGIAPVGAPIPNTRIYVLDAQMQPVPAGVAGEAYIAGVGLTRGYQGQPGLTAERFLPDPFAAAPGARIYRVGDRVRRRADGTLEFLGRVDQQVKVSGIRVETGEIEAVLRACDGVRDAVVVARQSAGETRLVAYVAGDEEALSAGALRRFLERTLPAHMIPSVFVRLDEFPLLPNGKVDRAALPAPVSTAWRDGPEYVAPSTETERVLAEIWESLLDVRPIGVDEPFFRLGGHSMLVVRLMAQIRRRLGVELPLAALFEHPTVRGLAARVEGGSRPWSPLVAIQPHGDRVPIFFVHAVGGEVLCYSDLARELGAEQPFYGLQAGDLVHLGEEEASIEEMAARYVAAIREARPEGPYLLGGWSFGGLVAFEMAQQLTRAGESVPLVAMLDTRSPGERRPADLDPCVRLAGMARAEAHAAGMEISLTADDLRPLDPDARIARALEALRAAGVVPGDVEVGWRAAMLRGLEVRMRSALRYEPTMYPGRIALFVPSERPAGPEFRPLREVPGWEAYVTEPPLKQTVPGDHNDMVLGENAAALATHLRAAIEESLPAAHV
ncbi:MAG TPA: amino acid adenylation domain-containing protein, partial [Longimicrobium sp.]|nr:amino acid adenylation domain-containing protein [Longimicrobium sp.]